VGGFGTRRRRGQGQLFLCGVHSVGRPFLLFLLLLLLFLFLLFLVQFQVLYQLGEVVGGLLL
jgi:hypothetical protein